MHTDGSISTADLFDGGVKAVELTVIGWALLLTSTTDLSTGGAGAIAFGGSGRIAGALTLHEAEGLVGRHHAKSIWLRLCHSEGRSNKDRQGTESVEIHIE